MFGKNAIARNTNHEDGLTLKVQEVFRTIQGEGPYAGHPAIFVRLSGCNLRCHFCDTDFESSNWEPDTGGLVDAIMSKALGAWSNISLVVLTGGEPLLQNVGPLVQSLLAKGLSVQVETAGTVWPESLDEAWAVQALEDERLTIVVSPKTSSVHPMIHRWARHWKYIIRAEDERTQEGIPSATTQIRGGRAIPLATRVRYFDRPTLGNGTGIGVHRVELSAPVVWLQPCDEHDDDKSRANVALAAELAMKHGHRLCIQLHKVAGLP